MCQSSPSLSVCDISMHWPTIIDIKHTHMHCAVVVCICVCLRMNIHIHPRTGVTHTDENMSARAHACTHTKAAFLAQSRNRREHQATTARLSPRRASRIFRAKSSSVWRSLSRRRSSSKNLRSLCLTSTSFSNTYVCTRANTGACDVRESERACFCMSRRVSRERGASDFFFGGGLVRKI